MRALSVSELLTVWERGLSAPPFERALAILRREFEIALALLGAASPTALRPEQVIDTRDPSA